jgi:NAD(P)H-nitrite reductase large subunit
MTEQDELICVCGEVYRSTIVEAIQTKALETVEEVGAETGAGTHCGGCQEQIQEILDELRKNGKDV